MPGSTTALSADADAADADAADADATDDDDTIPEAAEHNWDKLIIAALARLVKHGPTCRSITIATSFSFVVAS